MAVLSDKRIRCASLLRLSPTDTSLSFTRTNRQYRLVMSFVFLVRGPVADVLSGMSLFSPTLYTTGVVLFMPFRVISLPASFQVNVPSFVCPGSDLPRYDSDIVKDWSAFSCIATSIPRQS